MSTDHVFFSGIRTNAQLCLPKKIVFNYSSLFRFKPIRLLSIFETQMEDILNETSALLKVHSTKTSSRLSKCNRMN